MSVLCSPSTLWRTRRLTALSSATFGCTVKQGRKLAGGGLGTKNQLFPKSFAWYSTTDDGDETRKDPMTDSKPEKSDSDGDKKSSDSSAKSLGELPKFPWRNEVVTNLLPRVTPDTEEQKKLIPTPIGLEFWLATLILQTGFLNNLFFRTWKHQLEEAFTYGFTKGLSGLLSNVFRVPIDQISKSSDDIDNNKHEVTFHYPNKSSSSSDSKDDFCDEVSDMITQPLRDLFQSSYDQESGAQRKLRIQLELTPKRSVFHRLFGVPFVSRKLVEEDKDLLFNMYFVKGENGKYAVGDQTHFMNAAREATEKEFDRKYPVAEEAVTYKLVTTVAAEVMVICDETFRVWDDETGELLHGWDGDDGDQGEKNPSREVAHLVTMERSFVTVITPGFTPFDTTFSDETISNWQITDIDDLLGPKKWYHVVSPL